MRTTTSIAVLLLAYVLAGQSPEPTMKAMERIAEQFLALDKTLAKEPFEAQRVADAARQLAERLRAVPGRASQPASEWDRLQAATTAAATEVARRAQSDGLAMTRIAHARLRVACITCHVTQREAAPDRAWFPATDNTVWGRIDLRTTDDEKRRDASQIVVFVDGGQKKGSTARPTTYPQITQREQQFLPTVLPIVRGTVVDFPNEDRVFHNVFSLSKPNPFDLGVYGKGKTRSPDAPFAKTGLVRVYCNIHPSMAASILVLGNPHFAVTTDDGLFVITGIPDGDLALRTWHELGGGTTSEQKLAGGVVRRVDFVVKETRSRVAPHTNKFKKPYRKKY